MVGKVNAACKSAGRTRQDSLYIPAKLQVQRTSTKRPKPASPNDVLKIDNHGPTIDITIKKQGHKSGSSVVVRSISNAPKTVEKEMPMGNAVESSTNSNWSRTLRDQNFPVLKQSLQQLGGQNPPSKHTRHENLDCREIKTLMECQKLTKYFCHDNKILDEIPVKQTARKSSEQIKAVYNSTVPSTTTMASSLESIEVRDRGVQYGGIFDCSNDRLSVYNPVRMLAILMQEMEGLVRDERSSKILTEMEQALLRIPAEAGKLPPDVVEKVALCAMLEASVAQLENTSKELEAATARLLKDKETLQQQVKNQSILLEESQQRERKAEITIKELEMNLNEVLKSAAENRKILSVVREDNKNIEVSQKLAKDLRRDLNEQIELAEQRFMEVQYLKLEKEKLIALSSYKDVTLVELRKTLKELQNHISEQLVSIREAGQYVEDASNNQQGSVIHGGLACSSPTSTNSKNSLLPQSCPELSEISLSTVDCFSNSDARMNNCFNVLSNDSETQRITDKTQPEFISLPGGETSQTISFSHRKGEESRPSISAGNKNNGPTSSDRKLDEFYSAPNLGYSDAGDSMHRIERDRNKDHRLKTETRKLSSITDKKQRSDDSRRLSNRETDKKSAVERCPGDPASIKEQFEIMFQDIRQQSKFPVHVPSPPRNYPHPDWSDSSLPTISGISESNIA